VSTDRSYSAEWIVEAPSTTTGVLPLADFGKVAFNSCSATLNYKRRPIRDFTYDLLTMENLQSRTQSGSLQVKQRWVQFQCDLEALLAVLRVIWQTGRRWP
jgi:hypothetical protein